MYKMVNGERVQMSQEEIDALETERAKWAAENVATEYIRKRKAEYPSLEEQLDLLWHDMENDILPGKGSAWHLAIKAVKTKYPKPE